LAYTRYCFVYGLLCTSQYYSLRTHPLFRYHLYRYPTHPVRARTIAQYNVTPLPPVIAIYILHNIDNCNIV